MKEYENNDKLKYLFEQWTICCSILSGVIKEELIPDSKIIKDKLTREDKETILSRTSELGVTLEKVHGYAQDLGALYSKIWSTLNDSG